MGKKKAVRTGPYLRPDIVDKLNVEFPNRVVKKFIHDHLKHYDTKDLPFSEDTYARARFSTNDPVDIPTFKKICDVIDCWYGWEFSYEDYCRHDQDASLLGGARTTMAKLWLPRRASENPNEVDKVGPKALRGEVNPQSSPQPQLCRVPPYGSGKDKPKKLSEYEAEIAASKERRAARGLISQEVESKNEAGSTTSPLQDSEGCGHANPLKLDIDTPPKASSSIPGEKKSTSSVNSETAAERKFALHLIQPVFARNAKWLWLATGLASFLFLVFVSANIIAYFSKPKTPIADPTFLIEVAQDGNPSVPLSEAKLPLIAGDQLRISISAAEPLYYYILCLDPAGQVVPKVPWIEDQWHSRSSKSDRPKTSLDVPEQTSLTQDNVFSLEPDKSGLNAIVLIARRSPLESDNELQNALIGFNPKVAAMPLYSNITVEIDRNGIKRNHQRVPLGDTIIQIDKNPLSQLQAFIKERVAQHGDAAMAICFSFGSSRDEE